MKVSGDLVDFVAQWEGFRDTAYKPLPNDRWTVGYGFTYLNGQPVQEGDTITENVAKMALELQLNHMADTIWSALPPSFQNIQQCQLDALTSLAYNIGSGNFFGSNTWALLKQGQNVSKKFLLWDKSGGVVIQGLLNRRLAEQAIYDNGDYGT